MAALTATPRVVRYRHRRGGSGNMLRNTAPVDRLQHTTRRDPVYKGFPCGATLIEEPSRASRNMFKQREKPLQYLVLGGIGKRIYRA